MAQLLNGGNMPHWDISALSLIDVAGAARSLPLFSFAVALFIFGGVLIAARVRRRRGGTLPGHGPGAQGAGQPLGARYARELRALGISAIAVILLYAVENYVRGYRMSLVNVVEWWQYATPIFAATVSLAVVWGLIAANGMNPAAQPVAPTTRRTWLSFGSRASVIAAGGAFFAVLVTTITAGLASSADSDGRYIYLDYPVLNTSVDAVRPWFYGWSFGVPVLLCLLALALVVWGTLRSNAVRPFLRQQTVSLEKKGRSEIGSAVLHIATAGTLLALGGAFRFIARGGSLRQLYVDGENGGEAYDIGWRYADFAVAAGWIAPVAEITAFVLLLCVAHRMLRASAVASSAAVAEVAAVPEAVR
jgi:hypothetical protein